MSLLSAEEVGIRGHTRWSLKDMDLNVTEIVGFLRSLRLDSASLWFCMFCIIIVWVKFRKTSGTCSG